MPSDNDEKPKPTDDSTTEPIESRVGYGQPPVTTRFRKGKSGNPKGRPKAKKNLTTLLQEALEEKVIVNENGDCKAITKRQAGAKQLANKVASGDLRVLLKLVDLNSRREEVKRAKNTSKSDSLKSSLPPDASAMERAIELTAQLRERIAQRAEKADDEEPMW